MNANHHPRAVSWFTSRAGRRYNMQLAWVVLAKLVALTILYYAFIAPQPRTDITPTAMQRHLLDATATSGESHDRR